MKRLILVSICSSLLLFAGCGDDNVPSSPGDPGGGDPGGGGLALGDACDTADDQCGTGLICHDEGSGAVCHTECNPAVWPATTCSTADEACGSSGTSGACVPSLALAAACDPADDLCGADARCADVTGGTDTVCVEACSTSADCTAATDACFVLGFLTGGSETARVCDTALGQDDPCDPAETYCDAGLSCVDAGEGSGAICWLACNPDGDWSAACGSDACVPEDYFTGTLDAAGGICTPFITDPTDPCDRYWDICDGGTVCADIDGTGYTCEVACDYEAGTGCTGPTPDCVPLDRVNPGSNPIEGVCVWELTVGAPCLPDADLCPAGYECDGDLTLGWACRQRIGNGVGACLGDVGQPCLLDDPGSCPFGDCEFGCPDTTDVTPVPQRHVSSDKGDDEFFCVADDGCTLAFEGGGDSCDGEACVVFAVPGAAPDTAELVRTCVHAGIGVDGTPCNETDRCAVGMACIGEVDDTGACRALCDSSTGTWPNHCSAQTGDSSPTCDSGGCCVDMSCFVTQAPDGVVGVSLPDFGSACGLLVQDCAADETCLPQSGAWDRTYCESAAGTAGPGDPCEVDGTGPLGCAGRMLCLPFFTDTGVCVEVCDPTAASVCSAGSWRTQTNCIDVADFGDIGPPQDTVGFCLPICDAAGTDQCPIGESCIAALGTGDLGLCMADCDAGTDQAGVSATCEMGSVCIRDLLNSLDDVSSLAAGTGTCDTTGNMPGVDLCTVTNAASDCASETCVETISFGADHGYCAVMDVGQISCSLNSGTGCPTAESCYDNDNGHHYCEPAVPGPGCDTAAPDCSGLSLGNPVCVPVAPQKDGPANAGMCMEGCTYSATDFPYAADPGVSCAVSGPDGPQPVCYHVRGGAPDQGFCAHPWAIPGAPRLHCDPDLPSEFASGSDQCVWRTGMPSLCVQLASNHEPTVRPEGRCVARCFVGAGGDWGTCGGEVSACAPDSDLAGTCLSFALIDPPCDPLTQTGCGLFETCTTDFFPLPPGGLLTTCTGDVGLAGQGGLCDRDGGTLATTCQAGLMCQGDTTGTDKCFAACDPLDPVCDGGFTCVDVSRAFFGSGGHVGLCMADDECDLVAQDDCGAGETCQPVGVIGPRSSENHALQCVPTPGGLTVGTACPDNQTDQDCEEGSTCGAGLFDPSNGEPLGYCTRFCDPSTPTNNPACPDPGPGDTWTNSACSDVSAQFNAPAGTFGVCIK